MNLPRALPIFECALLKSEAFAFPNDLGPRFLSRFAFKPMLACPRQRRRASQTPFRSDRTAALPAC